MVRGSVNANDEPVIPIEVQFKRKLHKFKAVIDTGFNGYLSIPAPLIVRSSWKELGVEEYELASDERMVACVFPGCIRFDGERMDVPVLSTKSGDILIGTKLLKGKELVINFTKKNVHIRNA